jgi:hypothetical protein
MHCRTKLFTAVLAAVTLPLFALRADEPPAARDATKKDAPKESARSVPAAADIAKKEPPRESAKSTSSASKPAGDPIDRIKDEGSKKSQVMATLSYLTDVIGPRLTGSPNLKRANEWTRDKLAEWGLSNAHLEAWGPFGRGWSLERFSAQVVTPHCIPLIAFPKAWSPGTSGPVTAEVVHVTIDSESDLARYKGRLKGKIVLVGPPRAAAARFEPLATRLSEKELLALADAPVPEARQGLGMDRSRGGSRDFSGRRAQFLHDEGIACALEASANGDGGTLFVAAATLPSATPARSGSASAAAPPARRSPWHKDAPATYPQVVVAKEHYNRLVRMTEQGESLKVTLDLEVKFHDTDLMAYNTVAEIPGSDLKDELVMLGGHMDSWHSGTGATDNAAGVSVAMEAVRILKALGLKPRRTIRIALWTGEEQGLLGSKAYVAEHFGKAEERPRESAAGATAKKDEAPATPTAAAKILKKPEYEKFSVYFNLDNGTGKVRGVYLQGNEAVRPTFRKWLVPFRSVDARTLSIANTGGTDHQSFDGIGLPGFQFIQDPIEYRSRTHHSNQDVYDRIQADDMKQASVVMAAFVYQAAMSDEKVPRKPRLDP